MANSTYWQVAGLRPVVELLAANGPSMKYQDVMEELRAQLNPSGEDVETTSNGSEKWWNYIAWGTTGLSGSGARWITKDGGGIWTITDAGRRALAEFPDPKEFRAESDRIYAEAHKAKAEQGTRRAWLVRGSSVLKFNLVPRWLDEGWCSLAASQLPQIATDIERDELAALAETSYEHMKHQERRAKVDEIVEFVCRMKPGDVVMTTGDEGVFIGDLNEGLESIASEGGTSNLRRPTTWRNPEAGVDFGDLPGSLQAKLKTGAAVADLTGELAFIEGLTLVAPDEDENTDATVRPPHVDFEPLTTAVAEALFVGAGWLDELVELLNEKRQLVLYGPPGTGKTFLARKTAAHLVGEERVRLVQFHPSYTYEDFFEGFRPAANEESGRVSLELTAGPLRRLATEATDHPDRAFILVIDELNRANIAKVFGELYFLLEYRDQGVEVLYGGEPFTLPTNLYFICTMNTADRSIALLDSAMRRRFAFVELHPATEPTASMLPKWLERRELPAAAGHLLSLLNAAIDDRDAHIGPSYFMTDDQSQARLARIFRTQIEPLLQETYYDRWTSVASKFNFDTLYAKATQPPDPET